MLESRLFSLVALQLCLQCLCPCCAAGAGWGSRQGRAFAIHTFHWPKCSHPNCWKLPALDWQGNLQFLWTAELATVLSARNKCVHKTYCMCWGSWVERECFPWLLNAEADAHDSYFYQPKHVFHRIWILSINLGWFEEKCCLMSFLKFEWRFFPKRRIIFFWQLSKD